MQGLNTYIILIQSILTYYTFCLEFGLYEWIIVCLDLLSLLYFVVSKRVFSPEFRSDIYLTFFDNFYLVL